MVDHDRTSGLDATDQLLLTLRAEGLNRGDLPQDPLLRIERPLQEVGDDNAVLAVHNVLVLLTSSSAIRRCSAMLRRASSASPRSMALMIGV